MSGLLTWRDAKLSDRKQLQVFVCTDEDLKYIRTRNGTLGAPTHPAMHEWIVQEVIRGLRVPLKRRKTARVGLDDGGVAAVAVWEELQLGEVYELKYASVAVRLRSRGGGYADEMMRDSLDGITSRCVEVDSSRAEVFSYIDPENGNSQRMYRRHKFTHERDTPEGLQVWSRDVPLPTRTEIEA